MTSDAKRQNTESLWQRHVLEVRGSRTEAVQRQPLTERHKTETGREMKGFKAIV